MANAIEIRNLKKTYGDFTLSIDSLAIPCGCIMGLIGSNGAGKSTMIKSILDLIKTDSGEITIGGESNKNPAVREDIGVVFDEIKFPQGFTAADVRLVLKGVYRNWDDGLWSQYVEQFKLPLTKKLKEFSRGMKMKLSLAAALAHRPKLLVLDEATSGIDPVVRDEILDIFLAFIQDEQHTILASSHIISDIEKAADYVTFINNGKIVFCEEKDTLMEQFRIVKCGNEELASVNPEDIVGKRTNTFGAELLMLTDNVPEGFVSAKAGIEDIMLMIIKNEGR
ncbi:MAG: ABC transporter ATP-binding protein [Clostridia bacterium]|nr:ABC transporter ATP-binding protein [Clostridia bacterium]